MRETLKERGQQHGLLMAKIANVRHAGLTNWLRLYVFEQNIPVQRLLLGFDVVLVRLLYERSAVYDGFAVPRVTHGAGR